MGLELVNEQVDDLLDKVGLTNENVEEYLKQDDGSRVFDILEGEMLSNFKRLSKSNSLRSLSKDRLRSDKKLIKVDAEIALNSGKKIRKLVFLGDKNTSGKKRSTRSRSMDKLTQNALDND